MACEVPIGTPPLTSCLPRAALPLLVACLVAAGGCASTTTSVQNAASVPEPTYSGPYTLSAEERGLDCSRLTGRLQVRLLALRGEDYKVAPSGTSATMRSVTSTVFGTATATNAASRAAGDRPVLEAYNNRLVELGCPSFDLDKELAARPSAPSPSPTVPAPAKSKSRS